MRGSSLRMTNRPYLIRQLLALVNSFETRITLEFTRLKSLLKLYTLIVHNEVNGSVQKHTTLVCFLKYFPLVYLLVCIIIYLRTTCIMLLELTGEGLASACCVFVSSNNLKVFFNISFCKHL